MSTRYRGAPCQQDSYCWEVVYPIIYRVFLHPKWCRIPSINGRNGICLFFCKNDGSFFVDPILGFKNGSSSRVLIWSKASFLRIPKRWDSRGKKYHGVDCCCRLSVVVDMKCWNTPLTVSWQHSRRNDPFYISLSSTFQCQPDFH